MKNLEKGLSFRMSKGFTLIELLVVVAIIGVLASVVLASLNSARTKGADASVKSNLANVRAQAEIYYDVTGGGDYDAVCTAGTNSINPGVLAAVKATNASGTVVVDGAQTATNGVCNDSGQTWAAQAPLKSSGYWCVDSTGASKANAALLGAVYVCP